MKRDDENAGYRHARLTGLIEEELRALLNDEVTDPALHGVRVRAVVLSVDYRNARVHVTAPGDAAREREVRDEKTRALERASGFLKRRLADEIDLKRAPDLRFVFDGVDVPATRPRDEGAG